MKDLRVLNDRTINDVKPIKDLTIIHVKPSDEYTTGGGGVARGDGAALAEFVPRRHPREGS